MHCWRTYTVVMTRNWFGRLVVFLSLISVGGCSWFNKDSADEASGRYGLKSGIVEFTPVVIMGVKTQRTIYFDDYGNTEVEETISEGDIFGLTSKTHSIALIKDGFLYTYDVLKLENGRDVTKKVLTKAKVMPDMLIGMQQFTISEELKKNYDYKQEGYEKVAGVKGIKYSVCLNRDFPEIRIEGVQYKNVVVKTELGGIFVVASRFVENPDIPASRFALPVGYTLQELDWNSVGELPSDSSVE